MFVGHGLPLAVKSTRIMPVRRNGDQFPIYATTPLGEGPLMAVMQSSALADGHGFGKRPFVAKSAPGHKQTVGLPGFGARYSAETRHSA
jgi:hypothetical protein